nr:P4 [Bipolaris maydis chrysovirus 2]
MSFISDPARPWCSLALSKLKTQVVDMRVPLRGRAEQGLSTHGDSVTGLASFIEGERPYLLQEEAVAHAVEDGCVASVASLSDARGNMGLDGAATLTATVPYDMLAKDTRAALVTEGRFFRVAPSVHQDSLATMMMCNSVEEFAKTVSMKLPRITSAVMPTTGAGAAYYNQFEQLRLAVAKDAGQSDYGVRLHNLARIVCHASVRRHIADTPKRTSMMGKGNMRSLVTAEMPTITAAEFQTDCWLYVKDEMDPRYRAFLTMGARGLHHFVSPGQETVYSRLQSEPEVINQRVTFVRLCGEFAPVVPDAAAYVDVLSSLPLALSYYYAYSNSLGLGHQATQVLLQCSVAPHVWGATASLPYRASHPRLDAATYLLRADQVAPDVQCPKGIGRLVDSSPLLAYRVMAGLGALLTGFTTGRMVALTEVLSQVAGVIAEQGQARALMAQVLRASCSGYAALEWISPFSTDPRDGFRRVVGAYRTGLQMLGQYRAAPIATLRPLFDEGVDMRDAMLASPFKAGGMAGYVESVVYQLLAGMPVKCASEADTPGSFGPRPSELGVVRSWCAVVTWVRYRRAARKRRTTSDSESSRVLSPPAVSRVAPSGGGPPGPGPLAFLQRAPDTSDRRSSSSDSAGPALPGPWMQYQRPVSSGGSSYTRTVRGGDFEPTLPARIPLPVRVSVDLGKRATVEDEYVASGAVQHGPEGQADQAAVSSGSFGGEPAQVSPNSLGLV